MAADTLGLSDIGKIISPKDFDKVDGDDYIMHEDGEKFICNKIKSDEYVFTNRGLLMLTEQVISKKSSKKTWFIMKSTFSNIRNSRTIDLDIEIKFSFGNNSFSIV